MRSSSRSAAFPEFRSVGRLLVNNYDRTSARPPPDDVGRQKGCKVWIASDSGVTLTSYKPTNEMLCRLHSPCPTGVVARKPSSSRQEPAGFSVRASMRVNARLALSRDYNRN
jgi:hypothetical protein